MGEGLEPAPFHDAIAEAPPGGTAFWFRAGDGTRLRGGIWPVADARATVLLLSGRTEYLEKYGPTIAGLVERRLAVATLDWRGQGLSDRPPWQPKMGHVEDFAEYQDDLAALLGLPAVAALPGPRVMLAHSMGGCIGLRALLGGLAPAGAILTAPMWGIAMPPVRQFFARLLFTVGPQIGFGHSFAPGTGPTSYIASEAFAPNMLTSDRATYDRMNAQLAEVPALGLGGPSLAWLRAAHAETAALAAAPMPDVPALAFLGSDETVVDPGAVRRGIARMPRGRLVELDGARHEVLMEAAHYRARFWAEAEAFLTEIGL